MDKKEFLKIYRKAKKSDRLSTEDVGNSRKVSQFSDLNGIILLSDLIKETDSINIISSLFYDTLFFKVSSSDLHDNVSESDVLALMAFDIYYDELKDKFFKYIC